MSGLPKYIYIVVAEHSLSSEEKSSCPIAFESEHLDLESAKKFQKRVGLKYGKTAIYKAHKIKEIKCK